MPNLTAPVLRYRRGGLRFGALTGLFFGVQLLSSIARDRRDMQDTVNAALVTGGLFGALCEPPGFPVPQKKC